jgi:hypothetical protein
MLVFISWSGPRSKFIAEALENWIAQVIQAVEPWISQDIDKGLRWGPEVADRLERSKVGIICLTKSNLDARWIHFEAGALSKTKDAYVCTLLLDIKPSDVEQPLAQFQHTTTEKEQIFKLLSTINGVVQKEGEKALPEARLRDVFETYWPRLEEAFQGMAAIQESAMIPARTDNEMLQEVLEILRNNERRRNRYEPQLIAILHQLYKHQILPEIILDSTEDIAREKDGVLLTITEAKIMSTMQESPEPLSIPEIARKLGGSVSMNLIKKTLQALYEKNFVLKLYDANKGRQGHVIKYRLV